MAAAIMAAEQEAAKGGGRNRGGVQRVEGKLRASVEKGDYYEAHQMYRTLFFRYGPARPAPPPPGLPEPSHAPYPAAARRAHAASALVRAAACLRFLPSHWSAGGAERGGQACGRVG